VKHYYSDVKLFTKISSGVEKLSKNVKITLGPAGRNVILAPAGQKAFITKDGVTVAKFVDLEDVGAQLLKQVAMQTNSQAGDGTTTSIVLAEELLKNAKRAVLSGRKPIDVRRGMDLALKDVLDYLEKGSKKVESLEDIRHIATISANNDEAIGKIISMAVDQAGKNGAINIEEARSIETSLELREGFVFDAGYTSNQFLTDERRQIAKYEDCLFFISDHKLEQVEPVMKVLELAARENRPLVIVAEEIEGQLLAALIMNRLRGSMRVIAVKAPKYGEERRNILRDLSLNTGATFFTRLSGNNFDDFKLSDFGKAKVIEVQKNSTTIVGGDCKYEDIEARIEALKEEIKQTDNIDRCKIIQERITRLSSGVATIRVGGSTEVEVIEKRHRIEDALEAVKAAQKGGFHAGGGMALVKAGKALNNKNPKSDIDAGYQVVIESLSSPFKAMCENAGFSGEAFLEKARLLKADHGYDFNIGKKKDMMEAGIIDPVFVTSAAITNSISVIGTMITTNCAIVEEA
jgi:chaperonin GroEL